MTKMNTLDRKNVEDILALTPMQEGLLFHYLKDPAGEPYFEQLCLVLAGEIDRRVFEEAWNVVVQNNEMLRVVFRWENMDKPVQLILKEHRLLPEYYDFSADEPTRKKKRLQEVKDKDRAEKFDLRKAEVPFRIILCKIEDKKHEMIVSNHHILYDGWSNGTILKEFFNAYNALSNGNALEKPGKAKFKEFIRWQQHRDKNRQREFWTDYLDGYDTLAELSIKRKRKRTGTESLENFRMRFASKDFKKVIDAFIKKHKITFATLLYSAWGILLQKYTNNSDVVFATSVSGRSGKVRGVEDIVGLFVNMLPLRVKTGSDEKVADLLRRLDGTLKTMEEHETDSLLTIKEFSQLGPQEELFDTVLSLFNYPVDSRLMLKNSALSVDSYTVIEKTHYDLGVGLFVFDEIDIVTDFNKELFDEEAVARLCRHFKNIVENIVKRPGIAVSEMEMLSEEDREQVLFGFNDPRAEYATGKTMHQLFEEQVERTPNHMAAVYGDDKLTYRELDANANRLARLMRKKGIKSGDIVALMVEPSFDMITWILATLKAGAAYLPLDPESPGNRITYMLQDSNAKLLLTKLEHLEGKSITGIQDLGRIGNIQPHLTPKRPQIKNFEGLGIPDRSLVDYEKYNQYLGQSIFKHYLAIQATRGCPYHCTYCHKIWPKSHIVRSAQHIFDEVKLYYDMGVKRFTFIDDIFNLNIKNSRCFFETVIKNKMDVQISFPNGVRADILTHDYIDLMIEAGTINMAFALETASPRLQKLLKKNVKLDRFRDNLEYICKKYPDVLIDLFTMHGFPTETKEEAMMTLNFIKSLKWVHFPYVFILKIFPNSEMADFAIEHGVSPKAINESANLFFHELPTTLPFDQNFTRMYQTQFTNGYFMSKERLLHVLPHQIKVLTEDELVQKYNSYLAADIRSLKDFLALTNISEEELDTRNLLDERHMEIPDLNAKIRRQFPAKPVAKKALKVLLLDLSQYFSEDSSQLNELIDPPLGLMYLLTHLIEKLGDKVTGKIAKPFIDFDNYEGLKALLAEFKPDVIGLRTLSIYKDFFHQTIALIRHWGYDMPLIVGGPYPTSAYKTILRDKNIDCVVMGEGEETFLELITKIMENDNKMPAESELKEVAGLAFQPSSAAAKGAFGKEILLPREAREALEKESAAPLNMTAEPGNAAYVIYTSGSTGNPKGVPITHYNMATLLHWGKEHIKIGPLDRTVQNVNYCFDWFVWENFITLTTGAALYYPPGGTRLDPKRLADFIEKNGITVLHMTPAHHKYLVNVERPLKSLRHLLIGGEKLTVDLVERTFRLVGKECRFINMYGLTEATVISTALELDRQAIAGYERLSGIPIGKPLGNTAMLILDDDMKLCPPGVTGELYFAGDSLSHGYLNNPQLTAKRFVDNPYREPIAKGRWPETYSRLYKTGDLGCWLPDGNVECLGRIDHQVKIRGYRIELGEIENRLLEHPDVREAVVVAKEMKNGEKYLCAYVVFGSDGGFEENAALANELSRYLSQSLAAYMVPATFVQMDGIPLNSSNKVDLKRLPDPETGYVGKNYRPPIGKNEMRLVEIWADVLKIDRKEISGDANFFDLGGHSLNATLIVSKIHKKMMVKVPLEEIFKHTTVRELAGYIKTQVKDDYVAVEPIEKKEYYPLSSAQKRMYILQQMARTSGAYNISGVIPLDGKPDVEKLQTAFDKLIERHESFRTTFHIIGNEPVQRIRDRVEFEIEYYDVEAGNAVENFFRSFDLSCAPLLRVGLVKEGENSRSLMVNMHHIIADGVSTGVMKSDFEALYRGETLPPLRVQYKDYARWQYRPEIKETLKRQENYWLSVFSDDIPVLDLPLDYRRPAVWDFSGRTREFTLTGKETRQLTGMVREHNVTLYMYVLAVFKVLFARLSGREDIVIGTPTAGRRHADIEPIIGLFVNTLAIRSNPAKEKKFKHYLSEIKAITLEAFENQEYPFENLVEKVVVDRDPGRNPLFDVMFDLQKLELNHDDKHPQAVPIENIPSSKKYDAGSGGDAKFDLSIDIVEGKLLTVVFEYSTKLFKEETVERIFRCFKEMTASLRENPEQSIAEIEIIPADEKQKVLVDFNRIGKDVQNGETDAVAQYPLDKTFHRLFEEQAARTPGRPAVVYKGRQLTYDELNRESNRMARYLRLKGVTAETPVGVMVERSLEMVVGVMAVLKAGGAYLPLDPSYPPKRLDYIIENSGVKLLIVGKNLDNREEMSFDGDVIDIYDHRWRMEDDANPEPFSKPENMTYVIYTSGSTGRPKGVMVQNDHYVNAAYAWREAYGLDRMEVNHLQMASFSFDVFAGDMARTLLNGGKLVICPEEERLDPELLYRLIIEQEITLFEATPSLVIPLMDNIYENRLDPGKLSLLILGSDTIPLEDFKRVASRFRDRMRIVNSYGVTEATIDTSFYESGPWDENLTRGVPIGKPLPNMSMYILDGGGKLQPVGVPGELYIGGKGVARGYLNNDGITNQRFLENPFMPGQRMYKTGDKARWQPDGNVEFLGRIDQQVKIRGFRIEPGEIENQLLAGSAIKEAVVLSREDKQGDAYLCAYMTVSATIAESGGAIDIQAVKEHLSGLLPDYMIPSYFVQLESIPLTPNGKVDYKALPAPVREEGGRFIAPATRLEKQLTLLWAEVLGIPYDDISMDGNFFAQGGHSLKATILVVAMRKRIGVKVPLLELFRNPTVKGLAQYINRQDRADREEYLSLQPVQKQENYALSSAQKRLYVVHRMDEDSTAYNIPGFQWVEGKIEKERLEDIFGKLVKRHESLRTSITMEGREARQKIHETVDLDLEYYEAGEDELEQIARGFVRKFDLGAAPLWRIGMIKVHQDKHLLMLDFHHIIFDGVSHEVLLKDFIALYAGKELTPPALRYKDYAQWQTGAGEDGREARKRHEEYWMEQFAGEVPVLDMPTDYPRPAQFTFEGDRSTFELDRELTAKIKKFTAETATTLNILFLAAYNVLLSKYTGDEDIIVGVPASGRTHPDLENILGYFVNMLPIRNRPHKNRTFVEFLEEVKDNSLAAYEHQDTPFDELIGKLNLKREAGRHPMVDTALMVQENSLRTLEIQDENKRSLTLRPYEFVGKIAHFDLMFLATDDGETIRLDIEYRTALFRKETVKEMAEQYISVLEQTVENPNRELRDIEIDRHQVAVAPAIALEEDSDWI